MGTKKVQEHSTGQGQILFMAAAKALTNKKTQKQEYSIKIKLDPADAAVAQLRDIAPYKVDTKTNRELNGEAIVVNFTSDFAPTVVDANGEKLESQEIPFFDGRIDTGTAMVTYKVIQYENNTIVRLSGIKLMELNLAPRDEKASTLDVTLDTLKNLG